MSITLAKTIHKFPLNIGPTELILPLGSKIIHVGDQDGQLMLWAMVYPGEPKKKAHRIGVYGTGHEIPFGYHMSHLGTVQQGGFVWHVFEFLGATP